MKSVSALLPGERVDSNRVQRSSTSSPDSVGLEMIVQVGGGGEGCGKADEGKSVSLRGDKLDSQLGMLGLGR